MDRVSQKVEIIAASDGQTYDVTERVLPNSGQLFRLATEGLSNFSFNLDNTEGIYKDKFAAGDLVNIYYDYKELANLTTIRFRGYIDGVFQNATLSEGWTLTIEGRDSPKGDTNEHFADTEITRIFAGRNNLDCWFGVTGDTDDEGNIADGVLYNSGMIMQIFDTSDNTWKNYKDLSSGQKDTLKAQTGYTSTHTETYVEKSKLTMSQNLAKEGDYDFYIYFNPSDSKIYFRIHPEEAIKNLTESVISGQTFIGLNRYGTDTLEEFNRIKEQGASDGNIQIFRTKSNTSRQNSLWIKDKKESNTSLTTDTQLSNKATARLTELENGLNKGGVDCVGLPTLQPGEKIKLDIPYIINDFLKVKSFTVNFGGDLSFNLQLQDRETTFGRIFKDRIDENVNVTPSDNPNGMKNAIVFDFSDPTEYTLVDCEIIDDALVLKSGKLSGTCTMKKFTADENVTKTELRVKANQQWATTYEIKNDIENDYEDISIGSVHTFSGTGKNIVFKIKIAVNDNDVSPQFDKINILYL